MNQQDTWAESISEQPEALPSLLLEGLTNPDPQVRSQAIRELPNYAADLVLDRLIDLAQHDPDAEARCAGILGLGDLVGQEILFPYDPETDQDISDWSGDLTASDLDRVYELLLALYRDGQRSLDETRYAVEALGFFSTDAVQDAITSLYAKPEKEAKISALFAMGRNGSTKWTEILGNELYNPDRDLQIEAITAAGEMALDSLGKDLLRLTYSDDNEVVLAAIWSLGQTGWDSAFDRLDELTLDNDPEIREAADDALEERSFYNGLASEFDQDEEAEPLEDE